MPAASLGTAARDAGRCPRVDVPPRRPSSRARRRREQRAVKAGWKGGSLYRGSFGTEKAPPPPLPPTHTRVHSNRGRPPNTRPPPHPPTHRHLAHAHPARGTQREARVCAALHWPAMTPATSGAQPAKPWAGCGPDAGSPRAWRGRGRLERGTARHGFKAAGGGGGTRLRPGRAQRRGRELGGRGRRGLAG